MTKNQILVTVFILSIVLGGDAKCQDSDLRAEGFVEPYRTIDVASGETGRVDTINIVIGQSVSQGDALAVLDQALQQALVEIASKQAAATGAIEAAKADSALHSTRITQLERLVKGGYARPEELMRAKADYSIANARVLQAEENKAISEAELARYQLQLERRIVRAPVDGIISEVIRDPGEYVSPTEPYVAKMIQVNPLIAAVSMTNVDGIDVGKKVIVVIGARGEQREGVVESIAPLINAESGTTRVRIRIPNGDYKLKAGERCWMFRENLERPDRLDQASTRSHQQSILPAKQ